jgi:hypothetical protein
MTQTSPSAVDLVPLLDRINEATLALRRSRDHVPDDVVQLVDSLDTELYAETPSALGADPYQVARLYGAALRAEKALRRPLPQAQRRDLRIPLEIVRCALVDIIEDRPVAADVPAVEVLRNLVDMANVPQNDLAAVLGVSLRTLQRWLAPGAKGPSGDEEARVRIVAQLVNQLRHSFTAPGVMKWFWHKSPLLGVAPIKWLDDPLRYPRLLAVARGSRFAP